MRHLLTRFVIAGLTGLLATSAAAQPYRPTYDVVLADIAAKVAQRTGAAPRSCGDWFVQRGVDQRRTPERVAAAIACGRDAAAAGVPFWSVIGGHGFDSWGAEGLFAAADGKIQRYAYDSDPSGGSGVGARFDSMRCLGARVLAVPGGGARFECLNEPWKMVVHAGVLGVSLVSITLGAVLARRSWVKTSVAAVTVGIVAVVLVVGALARLGADRIDLVIPAVACCGVMVGFSVRVLQRPARLAI